MFKSLVAEDLELVFDSFERKEHKKGDVLSRKGQPADHIGILRQGDILASSSEPLQERGGFAFYGVDSNGLQEVSFTSFTFDVFKAETLFILHAV